MTTNASFDDRLAAWLEEDSAHRVPEHLGEVLELTRPARQRKWWSSPERWLPMDVTTRASGLAFPRAGRLILVGLLVLALAALVAFVVGSRPQRLPPPFGPAGNGAILSDRNGDIYIAEATGDGLRPLISGPEEDAGPTYTHDGTRFVFVRDESARAHVMMADADGSNVRQLTKEALVGVDWVVFSPTDDRIAIVHGDAGRTVISILDVAGGEPTRIEVPGLNVDSDVLWRPPDGRELIFTARAELGSPTGAAIYGIRPDGSGLRTIVPERVEDWAFLNPQVSPDGRNLTYWMYEADPGSADLHGRIHLVDLQTLADRVVRFNPRAVDESELYFSPDGAFGIMLEATDGAHLAIVDLATERIARQIGPTFAGNETKASGFSPDGTLAFLAFDNREPLFIDVETGDVRTADDPYGVFGSWQRTAP